ncbi:hypothetical protein [Limosilactobacillus agrestimuris]|nr:hypothetical protein [Limosilactobacillus agrestimuris]
MSTLAESKSIISAWWAKRFNSGSLPSLGKINGALKTNHLNQVAKDLLHF